MGSYPEIERIVADASGLDVDSIGNRAFDKAVSKEREAAGVGCTADYAKLLTPGSPELGALIQRLAVPETWFFRDRDAFQCLSAYARERWVEKPSRQFIRVLSAPCSTGEEPYSIAITLLTAGLDPGRIRIDGVDLSRKAIAAARLARYGPGSFRQKMTPSQERHFSTAGSVRAVAAEVQALVRFSECNLVERGALRDADPYDVIFCKNLMIYLTAEARRQLIDNLSALLKPTGCVFVGHSEVRLFQQEGYRALGYPRSFALCRGDAPTDRSKPKPISKPKSTKPGTLSGRRHESQAVRPANDRTRAEETSSENQVAMARKLADQGKLEEAARVCHSLVRAKTLDPDVYYLAGLVEQASDRFATAEELFLKATYLDPKHYESLVQLSLLAERKGELATSRKYRERLRRLQVGVTTDD